MNGCIVIPVRNEEESISLVINDILELEIVPEASILIVDNGSTDSTALALKKYSITYLYEEKPGYGNACWKALEYLNSKPQKPDWVAFMDGDYSDYASDLKNMVALIESERAELVTGDRTFSGKENLEFSQRFGNNLICRLISIFLKVKFKDLGPLRIITYSKLGDFAMKDRTWGWNLEMNLKAIQHGLKILEIPVQYRKRYSGKSKISGNWKMLVPVGFKILYTFFKYIRI